MPFLLDPCLRLARYTAARTPDTVGRSQFPFYRRRTMENGRGIARRGKYGKRGRTSEVWHA